MSEVTTDEVAATEAAPVPTGANAPDAVADALLVRLRAELGDDVVDATVNHRTVTARVAPGAWRRAAEVCKAKLGCDYLSFVAGIDWMPAPKVGGDDASGDTSAPVQPMDTTYGVTGSAGRFQVFAAVISTASHHTIVLKTDCDDVSPSVQSWVPVFPGADWHERECWEMFGISFDGHPGLRHLYLPGEFEGHPLRKDFPLLAREVKPWPGLVDVEAMPGEAPEEGSGELAEGGDA